MNIVSIDPSLISTALTINNEIYSIVSENIVYNKKQQYKKWFEIIDNYCHIIPINTNYKQEKNYSVLENNKLETFQKTTNLIRKLVDDNTNNNETIVVIEGYSYSSDSGPIIDLVTFGTLLRKQFFTRNNTELIIMSPSTVKKMAAQLTYDPIYKGKKIEYRNHEGLSGGSFTKFDMYKVLTENKKLNNNWMKLIKDYEQTILSSKNVPKPIDDINDSVIIYHIIEKAYKENNKQFLETVEYLRTV